MNEEGLEAIYRCIDKTNIKEICIKTGKGTEIKITRSSDSVQNVARKNNNLTFKSDKLVEDSSTSNQFDIISPEVGFFNRFDPKKKQQYQKLRDIVEKGEIVATVVSLHTHHNIVADKTGKIIEFLVEQDQPVAYGQPLIRLEKIDSGN